MNITHYTWNTTTPKVGNGADCPNSTSLSTSPCPSTSACVVYTSSGGAVICPAGKYMSGASCVLCPSGTFKPTTGGDVSECLSLPQNTQATSDKSSFNCLPGTSLISSASILVGCQPMTYG